jgi:hypothetical protein
MRNTVKAILVVVLAVSGCGNIDTGGEPLDVPVEAQEAEATEASWPKAAWTEASYCQAAHTARWATTLGVSPPALLGKIGAACCPAAGKYIATCDCPLHGSTAACEVTVAADCTATLVGHSEYNMAVTLKL